MARKIKISNERLKRFAHAEKRRAKDTRARRRYYLIVCEGTKTEPNYFEALKQDLPRGVLTAVDINIHGAGMNTLSLVNAAVQLKARYEKDMTRAIDRLWVVFDRDSFQPNDFNNAVSGCHPHIGCAWSNEAFELWYLLHFHYYNNAVVRTDYQRLIEQNLRPLLGNGYQYQKNNPDMYAILKQHGSLEDAIRNARRLELNYAGAQNFAGHNPCTMVYKLVEELMALKEVE